MQIAKVIGTVVSSYKLPAMQGIKLSLVQFVNEEGQLIPRYEVAADSAVGAGVEEWVLISQRAIAPDPGGKDQRPIDAMVVAIIDTVTLGNRTLYSKKDEYR